MVEQSERDHQNQLFNYRRQYKQFSVLDLAATYSYLATGVPAGLELALGNFREAGGFLMAFAFMLVFQGTVKSKIKTLQRNAVIEGYTLQDIIK